jgi:glycosyltransferase involved in cell wall biosynthesis
VRIVHLVLGGDIAGGQLVALRLAHAARAAGHDVSLISPTDGPIVARARNEGFDAAVVPLGGALDVAALARLTRALRRARAEVVHTHAHFSINVLGRLAGRLAGARVLAHMHIDNAFRPGRGRRAQVWLDNMSARLCFAIVAVSEATRRSLLAQGYPAGRLVTIHNGVEAAEPVEPVELAPAPVILEVARLAPVKGQADLLAALPSVAANVVLVGRDLETGGAYEDALRDEAERLGVADRVIFAGQRDDVAALMAGAAVVCLPSHAEGLPLVVLEAMAHGRPVVATAVGGTPELVVDGETGILVRPGDVDGLARALGELLADRDRAARLGEAGRRRALERFSAATAARRVLTLVEFGRTMDV